jgi:hypothetical protein
MGRLASESAIITDNIVNLCPLGDMERFNAFDSPGFPMGAELFDCAFYDIWMRPVACDVVKLLQAFPHVRVFCLIGQLVTIPLVQGFAWVLTRLVFCYRWPSLIESLSKGWSLRDRVNGESIAC